MNKHLHLTLAIAAALSFSVAQAQTMSKTEHSAGKTRISADYKAGKTACDTFSANAKDVCVEEAKAKEKVAMAELEFGYSGKPADQAKVRVVKAESDYAVAKERCDDKSGQGKSVCREEAKAVETRALADAKLSKEIGAAQKEASSDKNTANYKLAIEKCGTLASDAKSTCETSAKAKFGKN